MIVKRLLGVKMILLVMSGKGGVGKSVVSATLAAILGKAGLSVGLLDADIYGPSSALLFGTQARPKEGRAGLIPPDVGGVEVMSVDLYAPGRPLPLTGGGAREVLNEMLALTHWGNLDYLVIDMPPATADITMLFTSLRRRGLAAIVVTTPDRLSLTVARRVLRLLDSGRIPTAGVIGNMHRPHGPVVAGEGPARLAEEFGVVFLGTLPFDPKVLSAVEKGGVGTLLGTRFANALRLCAEAHLISQEPSPDRA